MRFKWLDLIFPWGLGLLTGGLALWATLGGAETGGVVSSWALFGLVFVLGIALYVMRARAWRADLVLGSFRFRFGDRNHPARADLEAWIRSVVAFWETDGYPATGCKLGTLVSAGRAKGLIVFKDAYKIELKAWDMVVRGWSKDGVAVIGIHPGMTALEDMAYVRSLFRHEVSHLILTACGIPGERHHALFSKYGLGA